jgi:small redox-active disulfide protein 2
LKIEILGTGCPRCEQLFGNVQRALRELGIEAEVAKITDLKEIMRRGPLITPGLVVDGKLLSSGKVLDNQQMKELLLKEERE